MQAKFLIASVILALSLGWAGTARAQSRVEKDLLGEKEVPAVGPRR